MVYQFEYYCPPGIGERRRPAKKSLSVSPTSTLTRDDTSTRSMDLLSSESSDDNNRNQQRDGAASPVSKKNHSSSPPGLARASAIPSAHLASSETTAMSSSSAASSSSSSNEFDSSSSSSPEEKAHRNYYTATPEEEIETIDRYPYQYQHRSYAVPKKDGSGFDLRVPLPEHLANLGGSDYVCNDDVHPGKQRMKKQRKRKTAAGTIGGMLVGGVALGPVGVIAGALWGGIATREISKKGEKRAQRKHEQRSFQLCALSRGAHWRKSGAVYC